MNDSNSHRLEREKRELLQIEDIKVGTGPVAAWGRRLFADLTVHYSDGTLVYQGPIYTYVGFIDITGIENDVRGGNLLRTNNPGIKIGLNGMAVGGRRRFTADRSLICQGIPIDAGPKTGCRNSDLPQLDPNAPIWHVY